MRIPRSWPLLLPALLAAEHVGHVLTHWIEQPDPSLRAVLLEETGHGYMAFLERVVALCLVLIAAAVVGRVAASFRNRPLDAPPSWGWAFLLPAVFVLQEAAGGGEAVLARPVLPLGIVVELACGLVCLALVRRVLLAAHGVGRALASRSAAPIRLVAPPLAALTAQVIVLRVPALAWRRGERAPPSSG
jgi:hypothetical protein